MDAVNLTQKLASFSETWSPKVVAELNGQYVKLVKFQGEYVWHHHANEDEMFLVIDGRIDIHFRDRVVSLGPGEFCVVPRGVEHKPVAEKLASVLLFEPATTRTPATLITRTRSRRKRSSGSSPSAAGTSSCPPPPPCPGCSTRRPAVC
ncbi:MAG TPA: cupin domain-containing protein [Phycisphaerae bacterium]|nr:cupin domain-containing protein [Phycisphaerae bacterium]